MADALTTDVAVELGERSYTVRVTDRGDGFAPFVTEALRSRWAGKACRQALFVTDDHVAPRVDPYAQALGTIDIASQSVVLPPGELTKNFANAQTVWDELVRIKADRHVCIIALGGGVIGDLAGFAAATYARGLPLIMIPTTLLAQVDSSVGGKVGINHPHAKNIIGAFHQPAGVWIDISTLDTLPLRELRCGLAEVVKYGVILDAPFFEELESNASAILDRQTDAIRGIIAQSCRLKAQVVSADEREETGLRAALNFGHTIGHAIEAVAGYGGGFQHGEAVAIGMVAECRLAERLGFINEHVTTRLARLLERLGLPTSAPWLDHQALLNAMGRDKKNRGGRIRFVLPDRIGHVALTDAPTESDILACLDV